MSIERNFLRLFEAMQRIANYEQPENLRKNAQALYGVEGDEAIEMAYQNVLDEARDALKGMRRPK